MRTLGCLLGLLLTAMAGCQMASVSPIYTRDTVVIDDRVVGRWVERKEADREDVPMMIVEKDGRMPYRLRFGDRNEGKPEGLQHAGDLRLVLTRVGDEILADMSAHPRWLEESGGLNDLMAPLHHFFRVDIREDQLSVRTLDLNWLKKWLKDNPSELSHYFVRDREAVGPRDPEPGREYVDEEKLVLTDTIARVRAMLEASLRAEDAWGEPAVYVPHKLVREDPQKDKPSD